MAKGMFDLDAKDGSVRIKKDKAKGGYGDPMPANQNPRTAMGQPHREGEGKKTTNLDSPDMVTLHRQMLACYSDELDRQSDNRIEMAEDEDFYDNIQWDPDDAQVLRDRGQIPLVYNVISTSIDWITGSEKRARTDFKILPRKKEQAKSAEKKTALMKYLNDTSRESFHISRAFEDAVRVGIGWIEDGFEADSENEPLYTRYENWRNVLHDTAATNLDVEDGRYIFRSKWVDLDVAVAMFPRRAEILRQAAVAGDDFIQRDLYGDEAMDALEMALEQNTMNSSGSQRVIEGYQRERVRIIEGWYKRPVVAGKMRGGEFHGELFDAFSDAHKQELASGDAELAEKTTLRMHVGLFTEAGMLWFSESPYRHNRFPLTPVWGYRRGKDGAPYGVIRRLKDIQVDVNKRASKALHILSTSKIIMDYDALPDDMTFEEFQEEVSRPDAIIRKVPGKEITLNADRDLAQWHLELMSRDISMIQQASGVTDELLGRKTNATSGVAIQRRQDQGSLATAKIFDNLMFANQVHGEKLLSNIEQFMSEEKQFRITSQSGKSDYVTVNDGLPENDITRCKADYVISETAWHATLRQAAVDELMEAMNKLPPEVAMILLDLAVENMDLPNREEIVKRIRQVTGQLDPNSETPSPEEQQMLQQKAIQAKLQMDMALAALAKAQAEADKIAAQAAQAKTGAAKTIAEIPGLNVTTQQTALETAALVLATPDAAPIADYIMAESGFVSETDKKAQQLATLQAAQAQQQQAAAQQQQAAAQQQQPGVQQPQQEPQPGAPAGPEQQMGISGPPGGPPPQQ
jgi:hypothetical protein